MTRRPPLHPAWRDYRRRWWLTAALLLLYLPVVATSATLLERATASETPGMILAAIWMLAYAAAGLRLANFPCPSCGEPFHVARRGGLLRSAWHPLARRCERCGLPKWQGPRPDRAAGRR